MMWCIFHKWEYFDKTVRDSFMGDTYTKSARDYRICTRCGKIQVMTDDWLDGNYWSTLDEKQTEIFKRKKGIK